MLLSIIVPVYNVEQYLILCIDSLLHQGIAPDEYEIILVNDGSTDGSGTICDQYAMEHRHIRVIHKDNGGLSDARNRGMETSVGKYIAFVDSDDFLAPNSLPQLLSKAQEAGAEIVIGNALVYCDGDMGIKMKKRDTPYICTRGIQLLIESMQSNTYSACVWLGIYSRDYLISNRLFFEKGILHEDELWTPQVYAIAKTAVYCDIDFYYHCYRDGSITNAKDKYVNAKSILIVVQKLIKWLDTLMPSEAELTCLEDYICMLYLSGFYMGRCYRRGMRSYIDRKLPIRLAHSKKNKAKAWLFAISPTIYYLVNKVSKMLNKAD